MAAKVTPPPGTGRALIPSERSRAAMAKRLSAHTGSITTAVVRAIDQSYPWYGQLGADERSWISMIANAGVENFAGWFDDETNHDVDPAVIFNVAPRSMTRKLSLRQTVDLVRTSIAVMEEQIDAVMPKSDRLPLQTALLYYSRQAAFAAAEVYARAAESRGAWDEHVESRIVDSLVREDADETLLSRASTLGWPASAPVIVIVGDKPAASDAVGRLHRAAERRERGALGALQGERLVAVVTGIGLMDDESAVRIATDLQECFGPSPIVVGPVVPGLAQAHLSALEAVSGAASVTGWHESPHVVAAADLLPERVLAGNAQARRILIDGVFSPLAAAGSDLLETCVGFLDHSGSIEATARDLFVHPNTVRYRIKRIHEVTGYSPAIARDAYVLRLAVTLGRLDGS
ncbi:MAG: helix-turn-helix domain-containing protein [Propionibacteriaceae bacterium]|nr:helix-turn-helix domain-containing protein [Propionibacteriaceae bacterium]